MLIKINLKYILLIGVKCNISKNKRIFRSSNEIIQKDLDIAMKTCNKMPSSGHGGTHLYNPWMEFGSVGTYCSVTDPAA